MDTEKPVALIFRTRLLPYSETFIRNQAAAMKVFSPFYVGVRRVPGLELPAASTWIANQGGVAGLLRELQFTYLGPGRNGRHRLQALRPRLIHAHFGPDGSEAVRLKAALRVPLIVTYHGYDATLDDASLAASRQGRRYLKSRPKLPENVSQFIAVSHFIKSRMESQGFPADKILVHSIGVDVAEFQQTTEREPVLRVLFTGRFTEKKGCTYLLKAMELVQKELPDAKLILIGDGEERFALEEQARATLTNYKFLGKQPPAVVKEWMQKATVFCVPSITATNGDSEGFGIVFAEAQACGMPVVSFASGGIPEAVAHGQTGLLAPEKDWNQLAQDLLLLLKRPDLWHRFSRAGRSRVELLFDLNKQTALLEDIYKEVSSRSTGGIARLD